MKPNRFFSVAVFIAVAFAFGFSQVDTAYVPVVVNMGATVTIEPPAGSLSTGATRNVAANTPDTLKLLLRKDISPILHGQQRQANMAVSFSRGSIFLELHPQSFKNVDISLFSINGKQILHGKASALEAGGINILRSNVAEGVYLLSVKGVNGGSFASKPIAHGGGELNINVAFGGENLSSVPVRKEASPESWTIHAQANGVDTLYAFYPVPGMNERQNIILRNNSSSSVVSSSSSYVPPIPNPDPPTGLITQTNSTSSISIGWGAVSGAAGYYVYRSTSVVGPYELVGASTSAFYTDDNLSGGTTYYYRIAGYNSGGTGTQSNYTTVTTKPVAPTGVTVTVNSLTSITVSWASVKGSTSYRVYRSISPTDTYTLLSTSAATSYTNTDLTAGTTYYYKIAAYNGGGEGSQSEAVSATTLPVAPTSVTATANSSTSITISWSSVTGATGYYIYSTTSSGTYTQIGTSATTSYANIELTAGTTYYYKVTAVSSGGEGSQSNTAYATTLPATPTSVTATANSSTSITVSWSSVTGATGYRIYRSTTSYGTYDQISTSSTTSYTNTSLTAGTTYYYKVAAVSSSGEGSQSDTVSATTLPIPTGVTVTTNSSTSITVSWSPVTGITGYRIYRSATLSGTYSQIGTSETTSYANSGLTSGTTYYYKVTAYNDGGEGSQSSAVSATTLPDTPTGVTTAVNSLTSIIVTWSSVTGATSYRIYRSTTFYGTYDQVSTSSTTSYTNTSLMVGTTYYYKVTAYNDGGESSQSDAVSATTQLIPTNITATVTSTSIIISWSSVSGATGYRIYSSTTSSGTYTQSGTFTSTSVLSSGLTEGTTYYYKVTAVSDLWESPKSDAISATTLCGGSLYDASNFNLRCQNSVIETKCGNGWYNASNSNLRCQSYVIETKCGSDWYDDTSMQFCSDGILKTYKTVEIGTQTWMAENLNYNASDSKCYGNNSTYCVTYGRLYNWATAMALPSSCNSNSCSNQVQTKHRGICPAGWHIPSDAEWTTLTDYVGGSWTKLKVTNGWSSYGGGNGTDIYGFAALPGGNGDFEGSFRRVGDNGYWWSASENDANSAYYRGNIYSYSDVDRGSGYKYYLHSVRCLKDLETECGSDWYDASNVNLRCQSNIIERKCGNIWYDVSNSNLRCKSNVIETNCGNSWYDTSNSNLRCQSDVIETKCGNSWYDDTSMQFCSSGTLKTYKTVEIGTQTWMAENLNYNASGSKCNGSANCVTYGRLYNWATAMALPSSCNSSSCSNQVQTKHRGICPYGWHIPSDAEWTTLTDYVGGSTAGTKLKTASGWGTSTPVGTDSFGFAALPGGHAFSFGSSNVDVGEYGYWWSSTEYDASRAYFLIIGYNSEGAYLMNNTDKSSIMLNVRCLQD